MSEQSSDGVDIRGCIIGGTALVDSKVLEGKYPNRVVAKTKTSYISFDTRKLVKLMAEDAAIQAAMFQLCYVDMLQVSKEMKQVKNKVKEEYARQEYRILMKAVLADGQLHHLEKQMIDQFRAEHPTVDDDVHAETIHELGWSSDQYQEQLALVEGYRQKPV